MLACSPGLITCALGLSPTIKPPALEWGAVSPAQRSSVAMGSVQLSMPWDGPSQQCCPSKERKWASQISPATVSVAGAHTCMRKAGGSQPWSIPTDRVSRTTWKTGLCAAGIGGWCFPLGLTSLSKQGQACETQLFELRKENHPAVAFGKAFWGLLCLHRHHGRLSWSVFLTGCVSAGTGWGLSKLKAAFLPPFIPEEGPKRCRAHLAAVCPHLSSVYKHNMQPKVPSQAVRAPGSAVLTELLISVFRTLKRSQDTYLHVKVTSLFIPYKIMHILNAFLITNNCSNNFSNRFLGWGFLQCFYFAWFWGSFIPKTQSLLPRHVTFLLPVIYQFPSEAHRTECKILGGLNSILSP